MRKSTLDKLRPFLEDTGPNEDTKEWGMFCPLHDDTKRSASLNAETGDWFCHACDIGGNAEELVKQLPDLPIPKARQQRSEAKALGMSEATVAGWNSALLSNKVRLKAFMKRRNLTLETIREFSIGWDSTNEAYTIPVRDAKGVLLNIRFYQLDPKDDRRKIWSIAGHGSPTLYPAERIAEWGDEVVICEGELDALATIQAGFDAVTRTGAAKTWNREWNSVFSGKAVLVCHDMDTAGQQGNVKVLAALRGTAASVAAVSLPYLVTDKGGKDLTDYWLDGHTYDDFRKLIPAEEKAPTLEQRIENVSVLETFDAKNTGKTMEMRVSVVGKQWPTYLMPKVVEYSCEINAGVKCSLCPMKELEGECEVTIEPSDPIVLELAGAPAERVKAILRSNVGAMKCGDLLKMIEKEHMALEEFYVQPSIEKSRTVLDPGGMTTRKIFSTARHDTLSNSVVELEGAIFSSPKTRHNDFLAWEVQSVETAVDHFEMDELKLKALKRFQCKGRQRPIRRMAQIAKEISLHHTRIYGRPEMHILMDLAFHSVLSFRFNGQEERRGWLDVLIVGDPRTGKSAAAQLMSELYDSGTVVSCEAASFAGVVGGLEQLGGKEWVIKWGAIPINDRRLVVLDEMGGLTTDQIAQMSSIRSTGIAELVKIHSEKTWARTRLIWMGNPRDGKSMAETGRGVRAVKDIVGKQEDIARFDLAMSVGGEDIVEDVINVKYQEVGKASFTPLEAQTLLHWVWSRKVDNVIWGQGAEDAVLRLAKEMGNRYLESPPLVQKANVRIKIARVAVALAARTFSTDETYENVVVNVEHVKDAVEFMDHLYSMKGFGYGEESKEYEQDLKTAEDNREAAQDFIRNTKGLHDFLRQNQSFRKEDVMTLMGASHDLAGLICTDLWEMRMVRRDRALLVQTPPCKKMIGEMK